MPRRVKQVGGRLTDTVHTCYATPASMHVPGWDKAPGEAQGAQRAAKREQMGAKMTPLGRGVAIKRKG